MYDHQRSKTVNNKLRDSHCIYRNSYMLGISIIFLRLNTCYTPKNQDKVAFVYIFAYHITAENINFLSFPKHQ